MDTRSLEIKKGIATTSDAHLDAKFEVQNNTERDLLITKKSIKKGHIIYHVGDNKHYYLKTYPIAGNTSGVVWHPVGNLSSNSLDSTSEETVLTSKGANDLKNLIAESSEGNTYYLDTNLANSTNAAPNSMANPYHSLLSIITVLPPDDGKFIRIYSISSGTATGAELPYRNIIWDAATLVTYDFTGVNVIGTPINNTSRSGRIIKTVIGDLNKTRTYHFVDGKVSLISNTTSGQQSFYAYDGKINYTGHINVFNFKSECGTTSSKENSVIAGDLRTTLRINNLHTYNSNSLFFPSNSQISIDTWTVAGDCGISNQSSFYIDIKTIHYLSNWKLTFKLSKLITVSSMSGGTGYLVLDGTPRELNVLFNNCFGSYSNNKVYFYGGTLSGDLDISSKLYTPSYSALSEAYVNSQELLNFSGAIGGLVVMNTLIFSGVNNITVTNELADLRSIPNNQVKIESGLTLIKQTNNVPLFTGSGKILEVKGDLQTNATNLGATISYIYNSVRGINVENSVGTKQFSGKNLRFSGNVSFDSITNRVDIGSDASLLANGILPDLRLSSNVPLKNTENTFTLKQTIQNIVQVNDLRINNSSSIAGGLLTLSKTSTGTSTDVSVFIDTNRNNTTLNNAGEYFGIVSRAQSNSTFNDSIVVGGNFVGRKLGSGAIAGLYGTLDVAEYNGTGNVDFLSGSVYRSNIIGTGAGTILYSRGSSTQVTINNPNASVTFAQGSHLGVALDNGTVGSLDVLYLDIDYNGLNPGSTSVTGDLSYITSGNDVLPTVTGNSYFIKSLTQLPSLFSGKIMAPFFEGDGSLITALSGSNISTGTISDSRLSSNVALKNVAQSYTGQQYFQSSPLIDASTININLDTKQVCYVVLGGNRTLANPTNVKDGAIYIIALTQDGIGGRLITWGNNYIFGSEGEPTLSTGTGITDFLTFIGDDSGKMFFLGVKKGMVNYKINIG